MAARKWISSSPLIYLNCRHNFPGDAAMKSSWRGAVLMWLCMFAACVQAQKVPGNLRDDLRELVQTPAIPGYEQQLAAQIAARLQSYSPKTDNMGNLLVTIGSGTPHRLIVAPMDEPGVVISGITDGGYW